MTYVKMCGTWYKYPRETMSSQEHREFHAVVNIGKLKNGREEVYTSKATATELFELGQQKLDELDEWESDSPKALHETKLKRLVEIISEIAAHQNEAKALCNELFEDDVYGAVREVSQKLPELRSESEITHLLEFFGMPDDD